MIQVPSTLTGIRFMKDGGVSVSFATQELSPEEKIELAKYYNAFGYLLFKENEFKKEDIPNKDAEYDEDKKPSKRMRAVIYVWWKQLGKKEDFEVFYRTKIDDIIDKIKEKLI